MKTNIKYLFLPCMAATAIAFGSCRDIPPGKVPPDQIPHPEASIDCTRSHSASENDYDIYKEDIPAATDRTETKAGKDTPLAEPAKSDKGEKLPKSMNNEL